jgi:hypothetical protein
MNRKQIIAITVLGIVALMLGCKPNATGIGEVAGDPDKPRTISKKDVIGAYEYRWRLSSAGGWESYRHVLLENGIYEMHKDGKKQAEYKWSIVNGEILHIEAAKTVTWVLRISYDGSITRIAYIEDGNRKDYPKHQQTTIYKKINLPQPIRKLTLEEKMIGIYEATEVVGNPSFTSTTRYVLGKSGQVSHKRGVTTGKINSGSHVYTIKRWSIVDKQVHIESLEADVIHTVRGVNIFRINSDNSITHIAGTYKGKRTDIPKESQLTYKKIK